MIDVEPADFPSGPTGDRTGMYLVLDAALPNVHAGVWRSGEWVSIESRRAPAAEVLFECLEKSLNDADTTLGELAGYLYCEGPGSILGMRIASMAIRTWRRFEPGIVRPCYRYRNLEILAADLLERGISPPFGVFSDARRGHWNLLEIPPDRTFKPIRRVPAGELESAGIPLWRPEEPPTSRPSPVPATVLPYDLAAAAPWFRSYPVLRETREPEPLVIQAPEYGKWKQA